LPRAAGLDYEEHGGGHPGPPLVLIHGAGGSRLHWPPSLRRLDGARTLAVDLPGHGRSPGPGEASVEDFSQRLRDWRRAVGLSLPVLVGHSMGGAIALAWALAEPAQVAGLVLIGSAARIRVNPVLLEEASRSETFPVAVERILSWSYASEVDPRLIELARRRLIEAGAQVLATDLAACDAFDVRHRLGEIQLPTTIVVGRQDRMTPLKLCEELRAGIVGARLEIVEAAGHMVIQEQPGAVAGSLGNFLGGLARQA